jgi:hypothetical protein
MKTLSMLIKRHCETVGRDYESIHRTALTLCIIGETDEQARAQIPGWAGAVLRVWLACQKKGGNEEAHFRRRRRPGFTIAHARAIGR